VVLINNFAFLLGILFLSPKQHNHGQELDGST